MKNKLSNRICVACGTQFPVKRPWQRYCSARCKNRDGQRRFMARLKNNKPPVVKEHRAPESRPDVTVPPVRPNPRIRAVITRSAPVEDAFPNLEAFIRGIGGLDGIEEEIDARILDDRSKAWGSPKTTIPRNRKP